MSIFMRGTKREHDAQAEALGMCECVYVCTYE